MAHFLARSGVDEPRRLLVYSSQFVLCKTDLSMPAQITLELALVQGSYLVATGSYQKFVQTYGYIGNFVQTVRTFSKCSWSSRWLIVYGVQRIQVPR